MALAFVASVPVKPLRLFNLETNIIGKYLRSASHSRLDPMRHNLLDWRNNYAKSILKQSVMREYIV